MKDLFNGIYADLPVLVTGHTGFKGAWLTTWLIELGANVTGYSLKQPPTDPSNYELSQLHRHIKDVRGDICDFDHLRDTIQTYQPKIIFHMAAQPIVLHSVEQPKMTMEVNSGGTVNLLEAIRTASSVSALVSITTDKVYKNQDWVWGYRENDLLDGYDPYGASKAMAELAISSYRETFFPNKKYDEHGVAIASVRAGNVVGGGDFADYRLVPDCMQALMNNDPIGIRNPMSIRPWQHVLEPLSGYLWLGANLLKNGPAYAEPWNFGPLEQKGVTSKDLAEKLIELWGGGSWVHSDPGYAKIETGQLRLSWDKAASRLDWRPVYTWEESLAEITAWYKALQKSEDMHSICRQHLRDYVEQALQMNLGWTRSINI